jgi:hypothetical protein
MRLLIEVNIPTDTHGRLDLYQAKNQIANALEHLPDPIDEVQSIVVHVRDGNGNIIGTVSAYEGVDA